jgi:hypothetical protein
MLEVRYKRIGLVFLKFDFICVFLTIKRELSCG